jgi:uncharacterized protein YnzC (UPF0291/DUF896 family)
MQGASAEAVESMNYLINQTKTAALAELAGKDTEGLRKEISKLMFNPGSPILTTQKVRNNSKQMVTRLDEAIRLKQAAQQNPLTSADKKGKLRESEQELRALRSNWLSLYNHFSGTGGGRGNPASLRNP